jgi:hypothetical protein
VFPGRIIFLVFSRIFCTIIMYFFAGSSIMGAGASVPEDVPRDETSFIATEFPKHGVRLSFYQEFIDLCGGRSNLEGLTTTEVCERYVKTSHCLFTMFLL